MLRVLYIWFILGSSLIYINIIAVKGSFLAFFLKNKYSQKLLISNNDNVQLQNLQISIPHCPNVHKLQITSTKGHNPSRENEVADSVTEVRSTLVYIKTVISLSNPHSKNRISVQRFQAKWSIMFINKAFSPFPL